MLVASIALWGLFRVTADARLTQRAWYRPTPIKSPNYRVGSPAWQRLAEFTSWIDTIVPAGEVVAFRAASGTLAIARYASYLLPEHDVISVASRKVPAAATFMASFGGPWTSKEPLTLIARHPDGWIYRRP